jgi:hypothetical protein
MYSFYFIIDISLVIIYLLNFIKNDIFQKNDSILKNLIEGVSNRLSSSIDEIKLYAAIVGEKFSMKLNLEKKLVFDDYKDKLFEFETYLFNEEEFNEALPIEKIENEIKKDVSEKPEKNKVSDSIFNEENKYIQNSSSDDSDSDESLEGIGNGEEEEFKKIKKPK